MCKSGSSSLYQKLHPSSRGAAVQVRRHFQQGEFPSSHHREEGWPSDQENIAQHPLFARTGWCSDRTDKEHHPGGVDTEASRHFLGDTATPPRGDARRGIRFFQNDTSKPHVVFLACLVQPFAIPSRLVSTAATAEKTTTQILDWYRTVSLNALRRNRDMCGKLSVYLI